MNAEWYYVEDDTTVGPATLADLAERFRRANGEPCFVLTEGMSDWADAATVPAISRLMQSSSARRSPLPEATHPEIGGPRKPTLAQRARHELVEYLAVSAYLFVCFGSLLFYKSAILRTEGVEFAAFGLALVKTRRWVRNSSCRDSKNVFSLFNSSRQLECHRGDCFGSISRPRRSRCLGRNGGRHSHRSYRRVRIAIVGSDTVFLVP